MLLEHRSAGSGKVKVRIPLTAAMRGPAIDENSDKNGGFWHLAKEEICSNFYHEVNFSYSFCRKWPKAVP